MAKSIFVRHLLCLLRLMLMKILIILDKDFDFTLYPFCWNDIYERTNAVQCADQIGTEAGFFPQECMAHCELCRDCNAFITRPRRHGEDMSETRMKCVFLKEYQFCNNAYDHPDNELYVYELRDGPSGIILFIALTILNPKY